MDKKIIVAICEVGHVLFFDSSDSENESNDEKELIPKVENYAEIKIPLMNSNTFRSHFRMRRSTFEQILTLLNDTQPMRSNRGHPELPVQKQLLITIWCLANPECFRSVADRFGISKSTCWTTLNKMCKKLIVLNREKKIISWPTENRAALISGFYEEKYNFPDTPIVSLDESRRFMRDCLMAAGTPKQHATSHAALLAEADYRGHYSHGLNRLEMYVNDIKSGTCDPCAEACTLRETPATALVDGRNGLGAVIGNYCMELAMRKAKEVGVGVVTVNNANHFGIAGWYTLQAVKKGLIGFSFCNTSPFLTPTRAVNAALGTNPISFAAPGLNGDSLVLDMATTAVAVGKIEMQRRKGADIPVGWALDAQGKETQDAEKAYQAARLMPLGGDELHSGYKGFGLAVMVETLCGILSGAKYGPNIRKWGNTTDKADLGQCFIAIDPNCFAPGFSDRMSDLMNSIRNMTPADANKPVLMAGDPERQHMAAADAAGGVRYVPNQWNTCKSLAERLGVDPMRPLC